MRYRLVSANDKNVEIRDVVEGYGWVFWFTQEEGRPALTMAGMNLLPNKEGNMPSRKATSDAFACAEVHAREKRLIG